MRNIKLFFYNRMKIMICRKKDITVRVYETIMWHKRILLLINGQKYDFNLRSMQAPIAVPCQMINLVIIVLSFCGSRRQISCFLYIYIYISEHNRFLNIYHFVSVDKCMSSKMSERRISICPFYTFWLDTQMM